MKQIITSMLDCDLYKINMASVVFHDFPTAIATYKLIVRSKVVFPANFWKELHNQVDLMASVAMTDADFNWMKKNVPYLRHTHLDWLRSYRMDPKEVTINQVGGNLIVTIRGFWYRAIFWEVKLMAIISELYFIMTGHQMDKNAFVIANEKGRKLEDAGCHWIDFGTRRRYSLEVHDNLVATMKNRKGFLGTSNPHLAMKHGVKPHGTYAHESVMAMAALYGPRMADRMWRKHWSDHFNGNVGVALTDTFTSDIFYQGFDMRDSKLFDGVRIDSGDNYKQGWKAINHFNSLGIPALNKRLVFSDGLDTDSYIALDKYFRDYAQPCGGIGTHFTNDVGAIPINMVIKLTSIDFGHGPVGVVKLSDDPGKHTGGADDVANVKAILKLK